MKKYMLVLACIFMFVGVSALLSSEISARQTEDYKSTIKFCDNGYAVLRCDYGGSGCNVSGQCFCDEPFCESD